MAEITEQKQGRNNGNEFEFGNSEFYDSERKRLEKIRELGIERFNEENIKFTNQVVDLIKKQLNTEGSDLRKKLSELDRRSVGEIQGPAYSLINGYDGELIHELKPDRDEYGIKINTLEMGRDLEAGKYPAEIRYATRKYLKEHKDKEPEPYMEEGHYEVHPLIWATIESQFTLDQREFVEIAKMVKRLRRDITEFNWLKEYLPNVGVNPDEPFIFSSTETERE